MLSRRLTRKGHDVSIAVNGAEGVECASIEPPEIILMDINMPIMDGLEATRILKEREDTKSIPIIALTAYAQSTDKTTVLEAGCDDYLPKPIELPLLLKLIDNFLK